jgi:hypothetical protein
MILDHYNLQKFEGVARLSGDGQIIFYSGKLSFVLLGGLDPLHLGKPVEVIGLPVIGLDSYNEIYVKSVRLLLDVAS